MVSEFCLKIRATYVMSPEDLKKWYGQNAESLAVHLLEDHPNDENDEIQDLVKYEVVGFSDRL